MSKFTHTSLRGLFAHDQDEFDATVTVRFLDSQPNKLASEKELTAVLRWARTAVTDAVLLDGVLNGTIQVLPQDGDMQFKFVGP